MIPVGLIVAGSLLCASRAEPPKPAPSPGVGLRYERTPREARSLADFRTALLNFRSHESEMSPKRQAAEWLRLLDRMFAVPVIDNGDMAFDDDALAGLMPPPAAWDELRRLSQARYDRDQSTKNALLLLLSRVLNCDAKGEYGLIKFQLAATSPKNQLRRSMWRQLYGSAACTNGDPEEYVWPEVFFAHSERGEEGVGLLPLVPWIGEKKATPIIRDMVVTTEIHLTSESDEKTVRLAARIALQEIDGLKRPQWELAATGYEPKLPAALERRFPAKRPSRNGYDPDRYEREKARAALLVRRIREGDGQAVAKELLRQSKPAAFEISNPYYPHPGFEGEDAIYRFLASVLHRKPTLEWWKELTLYGEATGHLQEMPELLRLGLKQRIVRENRGPTVRWALWESLAETGRIDEALDVLYACLAGGVVRPIGKNEESDEDLYALKIARIGQLTDRPKWVEKGLDLYRRFRPSAGKGVPDLLKEPGTDRSTAPECLWARAQALDKVQLWTLAADAYAAYLRVRPEAYGSRLRLAKIMFSVGRRAEAAAQYEQAFAQLAFRRPDPIASSSPDDPIYSPMGGFPLPIAKRVFAEVVTKTPDRAEPKFWLAKALAYSEDYKQARERFVEALRLDPALVAAQHELDQLTDSQRLHFSTVAELDERAARIARTDPSLRAQGGLCISAHDLRRVWAEFERSLPKLDLASQAPYPPAGQLTTWNGRPRTPAQAIATTSLVFQIVEQLGYLHEALAHVGKRDEDSD